jgi:hypothetical protein
VVGNGSFGVVFQAKLVDSPKEGEDIAIKKVLQDKRFKVCFRIFSANHNHTLLELTSVTFLESRITDNETSQSSQRR